MPLLRDCANPRCGARGPDDGNDYCPRCRAARRRAHERQRAAQRADRIHHTAAWDARRRAIRVERGDVCETCGIANAEHRRRYGGKSLSVNHLDGDETNWDPRNLRVQCYGCHNRFDAARRRRARRARIVAVVGLPGTGKTETIEHLAQAMRWRVLRIDTYRQRFPDRAWTFLVDDLRELTAHAIVESNVIPPGYARLLRKRPSTVVLLRCEPDERRRRLEGRGEPGERVAQLMELRELRLRPDLVIDTTSITAHQAAAEVARRLRRRST